MINAKKSFGQNFLKDQNIINKIINSINITKDDLIIEIGPGMGALTSRLKEKGATLLAFEIDERMKPILSKLEDDRLMKMLGDIDGSDEMQIIIGNETNFDDNVTVIRKKYKTG